MAMLFTLSAVVVDCRDPRLDQMAMANGTAAAPTCLEAIEGGAPDITTILADASSPQFCRYISGSSVTTVPAAATCDALEWLLPGFAHCSPRSRLQQQLHDTQKNV